MTALLERVIDYAGLFPPARLAMGDAVRAYAEYHAGADRWMLGRFVVPASRLEEFEEAGRPHLPGSASTSWALSALLGADVELDVGSVERFNDRHRDAQLGAVHVDTVELQAARVADVRAAEPSIAGFDAFIEVPVADDPDVLIANIGDIGAKAKIRTGGLTPEAIPGARHIVRFMRRCTERGVPFKATAGLHHPLRAEYPLTYEPGAVRGVMYGYLNVLLAAVLVRNDSADSDALALLEERDPAAIRNEGDGLHWRTHVVNAEQIREARHDVVAFGSCSFREPVSELHALGLS
jgi:hypothetical protein